MKFYWWDDAVAEARDLARDTGIRHRVFFGRDEWWTVEPIMATRPRLQLVAG